MLFWHELAVVGIDNCWAPMSNVADKKLMGRFSHAQHGTAYESALLAQGASCSTFTMSVMSYDNGKAGAWKVGIAEGVF